MVSIFSVLFRVLDRLDVDELASVRVDGKVETQPCEEARHYKLATIVILNCTKYSGETCRRPPSFLGHNVSKEIIENI